MASELTPQQQIQALNRIRKDALSREAIVKVQRIALSCDGEDEKLMMRVADFLLDARQILRGGAKNIVGGMTWGQDL